MKPGSIKKFFKVLFFITLIAALLAYGGYRLYHYALDHAIVKIQEKVEKAAGKSVLGALNPFSWPGKIFGGHRKHNKKEESKPAQEEN